MQHYLNVVRVAMERNGKYLIIKSPQNKHSGGLLSFPGGKVEQIDEADGRDILRSAAKREVFEEVGLDLKDDLEYVMSDFFIDSISTDSSQVHVICSIFYCKIQTTDVKITASKREVEEYYWLSAQEVITAHNCPTWLKAYISAIELQKTKF